MLQSKTRNVDPVLVQCWGSIADGRPTVYQRWLNVACFPGYIFQFPPPFCFTKKYIYMSHVELHKLEELVHVHISTICSFKK